MGPKDENKQQPSIMLKPKPTVPSGHNIEKANIGRRVEGSKQPENIITAIVQRMRANFEKQQSSFGDGRARPTPSIGLGQKTQDGQGLGM